MSVEIIQNVGARVPENGTDKLSTVAKREIRGIKYAQEGLKNVEECRQAAQFGSSKENDVGVESLMVFSKILL
jgi:hypothetical protein